MITVEQAQDLLAQLDGMPVRLARATADRPEATLQQAAGPEQWSLAGVFAHVRASDDIFAYRVYAMLARDNPPLPAYDERRWAEVARYLVTPFPASLTVYTLRRAEFVAMLRSISIADWARTGQHEQRGLLTIADVVRALVEHEEEHCAQIDALVSPVD